MVQLERVQDTELAPSTGSCNLLLALKVFLDMRMGQK